MSASENRKQTDFHREQAIFLAAVEAASLTDRDAIVDRECGDDVGLRMRVEALLMAHDMEESLPALPSAIDETQAFETMAGAMIAGKYKLLEEIGAGGMGVVWMAEQRAPIRRLVAVKLIKAGMDSRSVIARFEAERQALAMMDHPNIARVLDGGITEQGRPYFAMELVRGLPVTEYCDQRRMTVRDRLLLFTQICHAVQHAHQKGIIHRDIKPGNVLVTEHDGQPVPKVIDFGLAKALGGAGVLTEHTLYTAFGEMAGTPLYTAPEQVAINSLDIDTRADIYALGVLLYELLTGSPPLDRERLKKVAWDEVCRAIREEEPPRPSTRVSTSLLLPSLAASRQTEPAKLSGLIKGDLDWIVLKALEKERRLRYDTATSLVADIERHLNDEPVLAAPPTFRYRARKFVRKHKTGVFVGAAIAALLAFGLATTTWQWRRANTNAETARQNEQIAEAQRTEASKQRDAAELEAYVANIALVQTAINSGNYPEARFRLDACPKSARGWEWSFLRKQAGNILYSLPNGTSLHGFSRDGKRMLTLTKSQAFVGREPIVVRDIRREFQVRDTATGEPIGMPIRGERSSPLLSASLSQDGMRIVTVTVADRFGHMGSQLQLWNATSGKPIGQPLLPGKISRYPTNRDFGCYCISPNGTCVAAVDYNDELSVVKIWNMLEGKQVGRPMKHPAKVLSIAFCPDGSRLLTSCDDQTARLWDAANGSLIGEPMKHDGRIDATEFSLDGSRILVTSPCESHTIARVWDGFTGRPISAKMESEPGDYYLGWAEMFLRGYRDGAREAQGVGSQYADSGHVSSLGEVARSVATFSADSKRVLLASYDKNGYTKVRIWDAAGEPIGDPVLIEHSLQSVSFMPGRDALCTFGGGLSFPEEEEMAGVSVWTIDGIRIGRSDPVFTAAQSPDGNLIVLLRPADGNSNQDAISVTDIDHIDTAIDNIFPSNLDLEIAATMEDGNRTSVSPRRTAKHAVTATLTQDGFVQIVDSTEGSKARRVGSQSNRVEAVAISPDGTRLITGDNSAIRFYDTVACRELAAFRQKEGVKELKFTPDGTRLVVRFGNGTVQIWDVRLRIERRKMWARRTAERAPASEYVRKILSQLTEGRDFRQTIRNDATISPLRKLVAIEIANLEIARIDGLFEFLISDHLSKSRVVAAVMKQPDTVVRTRMLALVDKTDWLWATTHALQAVVDQDDQPKERYQAAAEVADELLAMKRESMPSSASKATSLRTIGSAYYHVGRYEESIRLSRRAIVVNTEREKCNDAFSWCGIAMAQFKLGQVKEARASLKSATEAAQGATDADLPKLLATATKLINPPATPPASKPRSSTPHQTVPPVAPSVR